MHSTYRQHNATAHWARRVLGAAADNVVLVLSAPVLLACVFVVFTVFTGGYVTSTRCEVTGLAAGSPQGSNRSATASAQLQNACLQRPKRAEKPLTDSPCVEGADCLRRSGVRSGS